MNNNPLRTVFALSLLLVVAISCSWSVKPIYKNGSPTPAVSPSPPLDHPKITAPVNDLAQLLDDDAEKRITQRLAALKKDRQADMAVLTVPTTDGQPISDYSLAIARTWDGEHAQRLLLVLAIKDHQWHIQVTGALEDVLTKDVLKELGEAGTSNYLRGEYEAGIVKLINGVNAKLRVPAN